MSVVEEWSFARQGKGLQVAPDKSTLTVEVNEQFQIDLEAIPGAGYMWVITQRAEELEILSEKIVTQSKAIGGNSIQRFMLEAHEEGNYAVVFELKRKWEKSSVKKSVFSIHAR